MIAGMAPSLRPGEWFFCTAGADRPHLTDLTAQALCAFQEAEGLSLVLDRDDMQTAGLDGEGPMAWIQLDILSSLGGVGLTAAVSTVLAEADIACNVIAAFHHDHVFVPMARADEAVALLRARAASE